MPSLSRSETVQISYGHIIDRIAQDFGDHEGIRSTKITRWLLQFEETDLPLAVKILGEIKYYSSANIRAMIRNLVGLAYSHFSQISRDKILFVPIGAPYEGSSVVVRALRDELRSERQIKSMADLENLTPTTFNAIVFLDDFSGTGNTLGSWWDNVESIVRPRNVPFAIALLVLNHRARARIEQITRAICVDELDETHNVLSDQSRTFSQPEKEKIVEYCRRTGCTSEYLRGRGGCGLLVAFKHQCPNNSLPILWHNCDRVSWESLFKRYGL